MAAASVRPQRRLGPGLLLAALLAVSGPSVAAVRFGMDQGGVDFLERHGAKPDDAVFWAGAWNEKSGWSYLGSNADRLADRGIRPVVQWYYWAGDISPTCVDQGCWSNAHGVWKSRANWAADAAKLADALHAGLRGRPGVVVLETEFNKAGMSTWEPFDGYLAEQVRIFRQRAPELKVAIGFGNWQSWEWHRFDRAMGAADLAGLQTMRASTRNTPEAYLDSVNQVVAGAQALRSAFGKPILLHDLALSSYWEPDWTSRQERVVRALFARMPELSGLGVAGVSYRALQDDPHFTTKEYYGVAERHMGLQRADGSWKPALDDWIAGVKAVRGAAAPSAPGTGTFSAAFTPRGVGNDWWVETAVSATEALGKVEVQLNGGPWTLLPRTSWGTYAASLHAPDGTAVQFRATSTAGATALSGPLAWGGVASGASGLDAVFTPLSLGHDWWIEAKVTANQGVTLVEARVDSGAWQSLARTPWGTWARSLHAPGGSAVQFRAWGTGGSSDLSAPVAWP